MRAARSRLMLLALLAGCARQAVVVPGPPVRTPPPAPPVAERSGWVAHKVVVTGSDVPAGTTTVAPGETLAAVEVRTGLPAGAILVANALAPTAPLRAGQMLKLPAGRVHIVRAGETGIAIARAYSADWRRVVAANRLAPPYTLEIADRLLLPSKVQVAAMTIEDRAAAFRINVDDLITGAEPAAPPRRGKPAAPVAAEPVPTVAPRFDWPLQGAVLSGYGPKAGGRFNDGINLKAAVGDPVHAAADGVVAYAGDAVAGFGNLVLIKHRDGWVSAYGHNSVLLVARGDRVQRGAAIAKAGATGAVDAPQLHFELRHGRIAIDPAKLLPRQSVP